MAQVERQIPDSGRSLEVAPWWLMLPFMLPGKVLQAAPCDMVSVFL